MLRIGAAGTEACGSVSEGRSAKASSYGPPLPGTFQGPPFATYHPGIDIVGSTGNAIYASASGVVVYTGSHLHFELQQDAYGKVDPLDFVSP